MKWIIALVVGMLLVTAAFTEETEVSLPSIEEIRQIVVSPYDYTWWGHIPRSGAATLAPEGIGGYWPSLCVPPGSVPLDNIYDLLAPHLRPHSEINFNSAEYTKYLYVDLHIIGQDSAMRFYIADKEVMREVMQGLVETMLPLAYVARTNRPHNSLAFDEKDFMKFLNAYPLVPGDPPYVPVAKPPAPSDKDVKTWWRQNVSDEVWQEWERKNKAQEEERMRPIAEEIATRVTDFLFPSRKTTPAESPSDDSLPPDNPPPPVIASDSAKQSSLRLALGIGVLLGTCAMAYFIRKKKKK